MTPILALALSAALAGRECHVVTNTRILVVAGCDLSPTTIDQLTEKPAPSRGSVPSQVRPAATRGRRQAVAVAAIAPITQSELERRLERSEAERVAAVARRLEAERERDAALRARAAAERALEAVRRELARLRAGGQRPRDGGPGARGPSGDPRGGIR